MKKAQGISAFEMIIVVAIVALLASIAYPMYRSMVLSGNRSEALSALSAVRLAQDRYRANNPEYAPNEKLTAPVGPRPEGGLGLSSTTSSGFYAVDIVEAKEWRYTIRATAQGPQLKDKRCTILIFRLEGDKAIYGGGSEGEPLTDPNNCWKR